MAMRTVSRSVTTSIGRRSGSPVWARRGELPDQLVPASVPRTRRGCGTGAVSIHPRRWLAVELRNSPGGGADARPYFPGRIGNRDQKGATTHDNRRIRPG
jgi:hypothetical protein